MLKKERVLEMEKMANQIEKDEAKYKEELEKQKRVLRRSSSLKW